MLEQIAHATGLRYAPEDFQAMQLLRRIEAKLPKGAAKLSGIKLGMAIGEAEEAVKAQANAAFSALVGQIVAPPREKEYKIKRSPKGARIEVAAINGVRYSFGPIWNASVVKGKGIALSEANRVKLNHQALMLGIENAETHETKALAALIAAKL